MNDDYLWDKSGEPDPQIQELENILGALRYQSKPLKLTQQSTSPRRNYLPLLAIAATVLVALFAGGLWLLLPHQDASIPAVAFVTPAAPIAIRIDNPPSSPSRSASPLRHPMMHTKHEDQEALVAKQQLMFALRLTSEKLNAVYRRTQSPSQIKNQHKAG
jgi:hypothetical protein